MTPTKWTSCAAEGPMPAEATIAVARDCRSSSAFAMLESQPLGKPPEESPFRFNNLPPPNPRINR